MLNQKKITFFKISQKPNQISTFFKCRFVKTIITQLFSYLNKSNLQGGPVLNVNNSPIHSQLKNKLSFIMSSAS